MTHLICGINPLNRIIIILFNKDLFLRIFILVRITIPFAHKNSYS
jgi:hypothetical protein